MDNSIKLPANVQVCIKPRKVATALLVVCVVVTVAVILISLSLGRTFSVLLFVLIGILIIQIRKVSQKTKITPVLLDISCNEAQLIICMPKTRLMSDGHYANQRYTIDKANINTIEFRDKGFVFLSTSHLLSQAYEDDLSILDEHGWYNGALGFVMSNDSISQLQEFLKQNNLEYAPAA